MVKVSSFHGFLLLWNYLFMVTKFSQLAVWLQIILFLVLSWFSPFLRPGQCAVVLKNFSCVMSRRDLFTAARWKNLVAKWFYETGIARLDYNKILDVWGPFSWSLFHMESFVPSAFWNTLFQDGKLGPGAQLYGGKNLINRARNIQTKAIILQKCRVCP